MASPRDHDSRVDVGVVSWNTAELTATVLRRLLDHEHGADVRILVHDNASTDGTPELLADVVPEAQVEVCPDNLGFAAGVNRLLERSDRPWFLALNSDAWPAPGAIDRLLDTAFAHPEAGLVVPRLERPDGTLEQSTFPFPSLRSSVMMASGFGVRALHGVADRWCLPGAWAHDRAREVPWAVGAAWLMRRAAIDDVGGLDERFFMYAEDLEWCYRLRAGGWTVRFDPEAVVTHVGNASGAQAFGDTRTARHTDNAYLWLADLHQRPWIEAYRFVNILGAIRLWVSARIRDDQSGRGAWSRAARAHLHAGRR